MLMHDVSFVTTGGSIDKHYPKGKGSYGFVFSERAAVHDILARASIIVRHIFTLNPQDSMDMLLEDRQRIASLCVTVPTPGVVVTHGTDTMIETAGCVAMEPRFRDRTVVFTGALTPASMKESDADFNIGFAYAVARSASSGVYIAMNGEAFPWNACVKGDNGIFVRI